MARDIVRPYLLPSLVILMDGNVHSKDEVNRQLASVNNFNMQLRKYHHLNNNIEKIQAVLNENPPTTAFTEEPGKLSNKNINSLLRGKLIEIAGRGLVKITQKGLDLLAKNPVLIYVDTSGDVAYSESLNNPVFISFGDIILSFNKLLKRRTKY